MRQHRSVTDSLNSFLYNIREGVLTALRALATLNVIATVITLVYRFGYTHTARELSELMQWYDGLFGMFASLYLTRVLLSFHRRDYFRKTWVEGLLCTLALAHGAVNYATGYKLLEELLKLLSLTNYTLVYQHVLSIYLVIMVSIELTKISTRISDLALKPALTFIMSFILLIGAGTGLLMLPAMTTSGEGTPFLDALFMAVSASCVTGLATVDPGTFYTFKGQLILMFLIQLGGIGIVSFATFFASFMSKGVGLRHQSIIQDFLSTESLNTAKNMLRRIVFITLLIEAIGFVLIFLSWGDEVPFHSLGQKVWYSLFHSVSAFCNAGFSLFCGGLYTDVCTDPTTGQDVLYNVRDLHGLHFVVALLIIFGGLGFEVIEDVFSPEKIRQRLRQPWRMLKLNSQVSLRATSWLLLGGTVGFFILEFDQLTDRTIIEAFNTSFFQSVTCRTAGFNTVDIGLLRPPTLVMFIFLMFIGGSPGSCAGGIKTNTFYLGLLASFANIRGKKRVEIGQRNIPQDTLQKASAILMFAITYNVLAIFLLAITEADNKDISLLQLAFEQVSAFGTVGLTMNLTPALSPWGKVIIIVSMYIGRVGALTLALALSNQVETTNYRYPDGNVMVG